MRQFKFLVVFLAILTITSTIAYSASIDYCLQPEDILNITVYEQSDLTTKTRLSSEGEISFPLLGKIKLAGLTVNEAKEKIEELLRKDYLVNPQVQIFIEQYHLKQVSVLGSVNSPGKYNMYPEKETTVLEAIAMAGGFSTIADINGTRIIRNESGEEQVIKIKVTDITRKGQKEKDITLLPGDIVFVPESFF